jgi:hypothetical protein
VASRHLGQQRFLSSNIVINLIIVIIVINLIIIIVDVINHHCRAAAKEILRKQDKDTVERTDRRMAKDTSSLPLFNRTVRRLPR